MRKIETFECDPTPRAADHKEGAHCHKKCEPVPA